MAASMIKFLMKNHALMAVPAVHNRAVFARHVHVACLNEKNRPDAIAVELGPGAVAAVSTWFKELGMDRGSKKMPIMLGLTCHNRRIHPKHRDKAISLQKKYGAPLHKIPQSILWQELGYAAVSFLCLSPTDSIIEAIRCGVEFGIPVYGIDLEETAFLEKKSFVIEDPLAAQDDLEGYIARNQSLASKCRDKYVDARREKVMAAYLKKLLKQHKRMLFTGGYAHWLEIRKHINDPLLQAASAVPGAGAVKYTRVVVHPSLAVTQMDILPSVTTCYEEQRSLIGKCCNGAQSLDFIKLLQSQLEAAYSAYLGEEKSEIDDEEKLKDLRRLPGFESFFHNICAVTQQQLPNMFTLLEAAEAMMSKQFLENLAKSLLHHDMEWVRPGEWPHLPVFGFVPTKEKAGSPFGGRRARVRVQRQKNKKDDETVYDYSPPFLITSHQGRTNQQEEVYLQLLAREESVLSGGNSGDISGNLRYWIWPPCEYLLHGTAFEAAEIIMANSRDREIEAFGGALYDGVDVKATVRSKISGDNKIYVKRNKKNEDLTVCQGQSLEPTVFIFANPSLPCLGSWEVCAAAGIDLRGHVPYADLPHFDEIVCQHGPVFVGRVHLSTREDLTDDLRTAVNSCQKYQGLVTFGNPCADVKQSVLWLKSAQYNGCPILPYNSMNVLLDFYRKNHDLEMDLTDWAGALVRCAIPYAKKRVIIVAPDNFTINQTIRCEAEKLSICLDEVPLSFFSAERINGIRQYYTILAGDGGLSVPWEAEQLLGPKDKYLNMLPPMMQAQVVTHR